MGIMEKKMETINPKPFEGSTVPRMSSTAQNAHNSQATSSVHQTPQMEALKNIPQGILPAGHLKLPLGLGFRLRVRSFCMGPVSC